MRNFVVSVSEDEFAMLRAYADAKGKYGYEVECGIPLKKVIEEMVSKGIEAISKTVILDKDGNPVNWNEDD